MGLIHTVIGNVKSDLDVGPAEASLADWYWACVDLGRWRVQWPNLKWVLLS